MPIVEFEALELSTQLVITEALRRGVEVQVLDRSENFIRLIKGSQVEYIKQATRTAADTYIAPLIMENKAVTKVILREAGINVPDGVSVESVSAADDYYQQFMGQAVVIKPKTTNFGKGVTILKGTYTETVFRTAVAEALHYDSAVVIETFIPGKEYRFLVIGPEVAAVLHRIPANVRGDGVHSIAELVAEKNQNPLRGEGYVTPLEKLRLGTAETAYLALQGKDVTSIPAAGEIVLLRENSNISTGGDSIDFTDEIDAAYKSIAVRAAAAVGARICGADLIIRDIKAKPDGANYSVIELNFNPALHIHDFPYQGKNRQVERRVLDLLGF